MSDSRLLSRKRFFPTYLPFAALTFFCAVFSLASCTFGSGGSTDSYQGSVTILASSPVTHLSFGDGETSKTVTVTGLSGESVFIVKQNASSSAVAASSTGTIASERTVSSGDLVSGVFETPTGTVTRLDYAPARDFMDNLPKSTSSSSSSRSASTDASSTTTSTYTEDTREEGYESSFWVDCDSGSYTTDSYGHYAMPVTLAVQGTYCNVWVPTDYYTTSSLSSTDETDGILSSSQISKVASTFDALYPLETNVFGFEYGAAGDDNSGGRDGYLRINILLYDIDFDATQTSGTVGYFYPVDYFSQTTLNSSYGTNTYKTNYCEMFYIDSYFLDKYDGLTYSTLAHEFQHMINFNQKYIKHNNKSSNWYTEMLSMVAEDMLSSSLETIPGADYDVDEDGPIANRIPWFLYYYDQSGVIDFFTDSRNQYSYASAYAFGAYLARNYGGVALISAISKNSSVDGASVSAALASCGQSETTFAAAFARYPEAMLFSGSNYSGNPVPSSLNSFDRSPTDVDFTSGEKTYTYSFEKFDINSMGTTVHYSDGTSGDIYGVVPKSYTSNTTLRPYGTTVQTASNFYPTTDTTISFTVSNPSNSAATISVIVRPEQ